MPDYTVTVSDALDAWLRREVADHNARLGQKLAVAEWMALCFQERAVMEDVALAQEQLQRQFDRDFQAAVRAKKTELVDKLAVDQRAGPVVP